MTPLLPTSHWRAQAAPRCSPAQKFWLLRPGPLTLGLRKLGVFALEVVHEGVQQPSQEDRAVFGKGPVWCREVCMSVDGIPMVVARSLTPLRASHGSWQGMRRLDRRPLADILYNDPGIRRSPFEVTRVGRHHGLWHSLQRSGVVSSGSLPARAGMPRLSGPLLWARRSHFWRNHQPLMVSECFLPAFWVRVHP